MRRIRSYVVVGIVAFAVGSLWMQVSAAQAFQITIVASPARLQVGQTVHITIKANQRWTHGTTVLVTMAGLHHNVTVAAAWHGHCSCFKTAIFLLRRYHPPETVRLVAVAKSAGHLYSGQTTIEVFGLQPNGQPYPIPTLRPTPTLIPTHPVTPTVTRLTVLPMHVFVYPDPSVFDDYPTLWVQTLPGSTCSAKVTYASGKAPAKFDGSPVETDGNGMSNWTWYNDKPLAQTGTATVTCDRDGVHGAGSVAFHVAR